MTPSDGARARSLLLQAGNEDEEFLLRFAREAPALYGTWRYLKGLYKDAEAAATPAVLGALIGRLDTLDPQVLCADYGSNRPDLSGGVSLSVEAPLACLTLWSGFVLFDLSNPAEPRQVCKVDVGRAKRAVLAGGRVYVEVEGGRNLADRLLIFDLANPQRPVDAGAVEIRGLRGMAVVNHYLVLAEGVGAERGRLRVFDVSEPGRPEPVAAMALRDVSNMAVSHGRAYVASGAGQSRTPGLHVIDLSDPRAPAGLGFFPVNAAGVVVDDAYLEIQRRGHSVWILDPAVPPPAATPAPSPPPTEARPGLFQRMASFLQRTAAELAPVAAPTLAHGVYELGHEDRVQSLAVHRDHLYLARHWGGFEIVSLAIPGTPTRVGEAHSAPSPLLAVAGDQLYVLPQYGQWQVFDVSQPARPALLGVPPSARTVRYMRRRARRLMRTLEAPERFVETAYHVLVEAGKGREKLDLEQQWVSVDLLYGRSVRYVQTRHGRGPYVEREPRLRPPRRTREERRPEAWDQRLDLVRELFAAPDLPWQVYECMLKILQANREPVPAPNARLRLRFLRSASPLLILLAARENAREIEAGAKLEGEPAARTFFYANASMRKRLTPGLAARSGSPGWARPFAATLTQLVAETVETGRISGRAGNAAGLLVRSFAPFITAERLLPVADRMVRSGRPEMLQLVLAGFRGVTLKSLPDWLQLWGRLPADARERAWEALASGLKRTRLTYPAALDLVTAEFEAVREGGWRALQLLSPEPKLLSALWEHLLSATEETPALRTAIGSAAALELLTRSGLSLDRLTERLTAIPSLAALLAPATMEVVAGAVPVEGLFPLIAAIPEGRWALLRGAVLDGLRRSGRLAAFWKAAPASLGDAILQQRLLEDPAFVASLLTVEDPAVLEIPDPPFEALLHEWAVTHAALLPRGSSGLLAAATHPLPRVRDWALERVRAEGMDVPFALRLLESTVPASMAVAQEFFSIAAPGSPDELFYALALSDSPESAVRAVGREFIRNRWSNLPHDDLLRALSEHGDPEMNRFLAELLHQEPDEAVERSTEIQEFDRGVLRARNRGRRAKEQVKTRLSGAEVPDVSLLLSLARSGTPRDAEWAMGELGRLAAAGVAVEGISVEGVAGV